VVLFSTPFPDLIIERDHPYVGPAVEAQWQIWINLISKAIINTLK
jgi:hypothetical protein